uniref:Secreted protein n=1 Tax=Panagrellus redivivus TaxID=6233 RepID=A0A7E4ZWZ8_PANRE
MKFSADLFVMLSALLIAIATFAMAAPAPNAVPARPLAQGPEFVGNDVDYNRYLTKVKKWYNEPEVSSDSYKLRPYFPISEKRMDGQFMNDFPGDRFEWKLTRL